MKRCRSSIGAMGIFVTRPTFLWFICCSLSLGFTQSEGQATSPLVALSRNGYDTINGTDAICWRRQNGEDNHRTRIIENCSFDLQLSPPSDDPILISNIVYEYVVDIDFDLSSRSIEVRGDYSVQLVACRVDRVAFCTPAVLDESAWEDAVLSSETIRLEATNSSLRERIRIPFDVNRPGDYFMLLVARFQSRNDSANQTQIQRWDVANALPPDQRVVRFTDSPEIRSVSEWVLIVSFCCMGVSALVIIGLLYQTVKHSHSQVMSLCQGKFLIVFLSAALGATVGCFLLDPRSDLYCQIAFPVILIPVQLMYSITLGRLWRINAVISPLLLEHYRKRSKAGRWRLRLVGWLQRLAQIRLCGGSDGIRRSVTNRQLAIVVVYFTLPQVVLQICALILQPVELAVQWNDDDTSGRFVCDTKVSIASSILTYAMINIVGLILLLLVMAYNSRNLPSLFNETSAIYDTSFHTITMLVLGLVIVYTTADSTRASDISYVARIAVVLTVTVSTSVRLVLPKLRMVWRGESVVVSKLVSDHHRKRREERKAIEESEGHKVSEGHNGAFHDSLSLQGVHVTGFDVDAALQSSQTSCDAKTTSKADGILDRITEKTTDEESKDIFIQIESDGKDSDSLRISSSEDLESSLRLLDEDEKGPNSSSKPATSKRETLREKRDASESNLMQRITRYSFRKPQAPPKTSKSGRQLRFDPPTQRRGLTRAASDRQIRVSPFETPSRRLVLKMADLQEVLTSLNTKIMSGLGTDTDDWDSAVDLVESLSSLFRDQVVFSWKRTSILEQEDEQNKTKESGSLHSKSLKQVAKQFKEIIDVRDRSYKRTVYRDVFIGKDAVDAMIYNGMASSREHAVQLGRLLANEFGLFRHATHEHDFKDGFFFYSFVEDDDQSLGSFGSNNEESVSLPDVPENNAETEVVRFMNVVQVRHRRYHMKLYENVFVGSEAVDSLVYHGVAKTRWEAVQLGRKLVRKYKLFDHAHGDHEFRDDFLFYRYRENAVDVMPSSVSISDVSHDVHGDRKLGSLLSERADAFQMYVDVRDRRQKMATVKKCFVGSEAVDALIYAGVAATRDEAVGICRELQLELRLFQPVTGDQPFVDDRTLYRMRRKDYSVSSGSEVDAGSSQNSHSNVSSADGVREQSLSIESLTTKAESFKSIVQLGDRMLQMKKYVNVFLGCEAVDAMVYNDLAQDRREAVQIGRAIARELRLFSHVTGKYTFSDDDELFHFQPEDGKLIEASEGKSVSDRSTSCSIAGAPSELAKLAISFQQCLDIRDRKYRMKTYKECFIGAEAVDALVLTEVVDSRADAVQLGRKLARELRLFSPVNGDYLFSDDFQFYRLRAHTNADAGSAAPSDSKSDTQDSQAELFKGIVVPLVRDRWYHSKKYDQVFVGEEAVDAMVYSGLAKSRKEAVHVARQIAKVTDCFDHVAGDHSFCDDFLFYTFKNTKFDDMVVVGTSKSELGEQADKLKSVADIRDRVFRMKKFRSSFLGAELVDSMLYNNMAATRAEALEVGRRLQSELRLFRQLGGNSLLQDDHSFYRFREDDVVSSDVSASSGSRSSNADLLAKAIAFRNCADVRDRQYRLKRYRQCFVGSEMIDALISAEMVKDRKEAVELGRTLARELNLFDHVTNDHAFADDYLFYEFKSSRDDLSLSSTSSVGDSRDHGHAPSLEASEITGRPRPFGKRLSAIFENAESTGNDGDD